ncbi:MAG: hypothetical protein RLZZ450_833 [Pseudomonadota bacterium]
MRLLLLLLSIWLLVTAISPRCLVIGAALFVAAVGVWIADFAVAEWPPLSGQVEEVHNAP